MISPRRPTLRRLEKVSGGNPFYALEIAGGLLRSGRRLELGEPLPVPARLSEVVRGRLALLTPGAREAALAAATLAQPTWAVVQLAIGGGRAAAAEAVAACAAGQDAAPGMRGFVARTLARHPLAAFA